MEIVKIQTHEEPLELLVFEEPAEKLIKIGAPVFRFVPGTNKTYIISSRGMLLKKVGKLYKEHKPCLNNSGYLQTHIMNTTKLIHRIVAECFLTRPEGTNEVDHIDRNKLNNKVDNLRWVTHLTNCEKGSPGTHKRKLNNIVAINKNTGKETVYNTITEALTSIFSEGLPKGSRNAIINAIDKPLGYCYGYYWYRK